MEPFLFFLVAVAVIAVLAVLAHQQAKKRQRALAAWASARGLSFDPARNPRIDDRYAQFKSLRQGENRYAYNIMAGQWGGRPVRAFDYHYETYSTDSKGRRRTHHHHFSAVLVEAGLPLKPLFLRPEGFFDKVAEFFGADDIDFESAEFSRQFYVKSPDRRWAFDVIHQATMEFLLASPRFTLEFQGTDVIAYHGRTFKPEEFEAALKVIAGVLDRLPGHLLKELKGAD
ncbi:MAG: hypothetical protein ACUVUC_07940 [Thermoguttaceae bacterium]